MSGTNRLVNSANTVSGNSQTALKKKLVNADAEAKKIKSIAKGKKK